MIKLYQLIDYIKKNKLLILKNVLWILFHLIIILICFILLNKLVLISFQVKGIKSMMSFMKKEGVTLTPEQVKQLQEIFDQGEKLKESYANQTFYERMFILASLYGFYLIAKEIIKYIYYDQIGLFTEFIRFQEEIKKSKQTLNESKAFLNDIQDYKDYLEFKKNKPNE